MSLPADEELLRQMLPDDCFWFGPVPGLPVSSIADTASNYAAFLDYSHRLNQQEWLHTGSAVPQDLQATLIGQPVGAFLYHENHCSLVKAQRDIANDNDSSCSSTNSSVASSTYHSNKLSQSRETNNRDSSSEILDNPNEPENLSSRASIKSSSPMRKKSASPELNKSNSEVSNT